MSSFLNALEAEIRYIRERLQPLAEEGLESEFGYSISVFGRILDGDVNVTIQLGKRTYSEDRVTAADTDELIDEWMRRVGFNRKHTTLRISYHPTPLTPPAPPEPKEETNLDDEIPF